MESTKWTEDILFVHSVSPQELIPFVFRFVGQIVLSQVGPHLTSNRQLRMIVVR
jgi:hypothetical protein